MKRGGRGGRPKTRIKEMKWTHEENMDLMRSNRGAFLLGKVIMQGLNKLVSTPLELREDQEIVDLGRLLECLPRKSVAAAALTGLVYDLTHDSEGNQIGPGDPTPHGCYTKLLGIIRDYGEWTLDSSDASELGNDVFKAAADYAETDEEYAEHMKSNVLNKVGVDSLKELLGDE